MPEVPTTYALERLYHRVAELETDLRIIKSNIDYLERVVLDKRPPGVLREPEDNWKEITEHVKEELFNYDISHPQEDDQ